MRINILSLFSVTAITLLSACSLSAAGDGKTAGNPAESCNVGKVQEKSKSGLDQITLCITSDTKQHSFTAEIARSLPEQSKGLMFRESLSDDRGMLFPYQAPQILSFWMKNTVIPLDIIFIRADGSIESIAENTTPYSLESLSSNEPVTAVLEIRGGLSKEKGIKPGDVIKWQK